MSPLRALSIHNVAAAERSLASYMRESEENFKLTGNGARSITPKGASQIAREYEFVKGMCEVPFRFTGRDSTPLGLWLRIKRLR